MAQKKKWKKPKLIIIARGTPEEAVLVACKGGADLTQPVYDPSADNAWNCVNLVGCDACSELIAS